MKHPKIFILLIFLTIFSFILIAFITKARSNPWENVILDGGFLTEKPCGPPCFMNIVPGTTTMNDALQSIKNHNLAKECVPFDYTSGSGDRGYSCGNVIIILNAKSDIVETLVFKPDQKILVGDVIMKYGNPSSVFVVNLGTPEEPMTVDMSLYYDGIKTEIQLNNQEGGIYHATADSIVTRIIYFDQRSYSIMINHSQEWTGFNNYQYHDP